LNSRGPGTQSDPARNPSSPHVIFLPEVCSVV
jgi:hypothetical protein